jgi:hypothetical protein
MKLENYRHPSNVILYIHMFLHPRTTSLPPPFSFMHFFIFLSSCFIRAFFSFSSLSCSFLPSFLFHTYLSLSRLPFSFTSSFLFHAFLSLSRLPFTFLTFLILSFILSFYCLSFSFLACFPSLPFVLSLPSFLSALHLISWLPFSS